MFGHARAITALEFSGRASAASGQACNLPIFENLTRARITRENYWVNFVSLRKTDIQYGKTGI